MKTKQLARCKWSIEVVYTGSQELPRKLQMRLKSISWKLVWMGFSKQLWDVKKLCSDKFAVGDAHFGHNPRVVSIFHYHLAFSWAMFWIRNSTNVDSSNQNPHWIRDLRWLVNYVPFYMTMMTQKFHIVVSNHRNLSMYPQTTTRYHEPSIVLGLIFKCIASKACDHETMKLMYSDIPGRSRRLFHIYPALYRWNFYRSRLKMLCILEAWNSKLPTNVRHTLRLKLC